MDSACARLRASLTAASALSFMLGCTPDPCAGGACSDASSTSTSGAATTTTSTTTTTTSAVTTGATSTGGGGSTGSAATGEATTDASDSDTSTTDATSTTGGEAICGDGIVEGDELCDDGEANEDGLYGGCTRACTLGPRCGDGLINGGEACDDGDNGDPSDGCLDGCLKPKTCLDIKEALPDAPSGIYRIWPKSGIDVKAWCAMEADGGGYTVLKVHKVDGEGGDVEWSAKEAESICATYGLHLFAPRSPEHLAAAFDVAVGEELVPVGGGAVAADAGYLEILAIYPTQIGKSCATIPFNSDACEGWRAAVGDVYWVTDVAMPTQPGENNCPGCSMEYSWNPDGTIDSFIAIALGGNGFRAVRFLCEAADKLP
ncbi:MAG: fibrinogen-like YCDxxxxGGGW domain-containing protein [Nannocystaceae bacterium]